MELWKGIDVANSEANRLSSNHTMTCRLKLDWEKPREVKPVFWSSKALHFFIFLLSEVKRRFDGLLNLLSAPKPRSMAG